MTARARRSVLYMPGSNARALEKARTLPADAIILDLEDAVAPDAKEVARAQVADAVRNGGFGRREVIVRVNGLDTAWGRADVAALAGLGADAVLFPKISGPAAVVDAGAAMAAASARATTRLWAMIETPLAILNVRAIAEAALEAEPRLSCFVMGTNDLAKETRARLVPGRAPMTPWLMAALTAARAYGLAIVDGVYNDIQNEAAFVAECLESRDMGFDGKTLIHPNQIEPCNRAFSPSAEEVAWARVIIAAFELPENADKGALRIDGKMVERLHADMAYQVVAMAG